MVRGIREKSGIVAGVLLPMGLICLFAFCSLALALFGGGAYRQIQGAVDDSFNCNIAAGYLRNKLSQNNAGGALSLREEDGVQLLVIAVSEGGREYETRIYHADGQLRENTVTAGAPFQISGADITIARLQSCRFECSGDGLFTAEMVSAAGTAVRTAIALPEGGGLA